MHLLAIVLFLLSAGIASARTLEVGVIPNWKAGQTYLGFETYNNVTVDRFMNYFDSNDGDSSVLRLHRFLYDSCRTHTCEVGLQFQGSTEYPSPLRNVINGMHDSWLYDIAVEVKNFEDAYNQTVVYRPFPEFFGWWNTYGVYNVNNTKTDFVPAWKHTVDILRSTGAVRIKFDWNAGGLQWWGRMTNGNEPLVLYYPGDDYVDEMSMDMYNIPSISGVNWISFYDLFKGPYEEMSNITPYKPINVGETNSNAVYGNKSQWILDAFDAMMYNFTRMENIDLFTVDYGGTPALIDFNNEEERQAFREGVRRIREYNLLFASEEFVFSNDGPVLQQYSIPQVFLDDPTTQDSCRNVRTIVYAGLVILSLFGVVLSVGFLYHGEFLGTAVTIVAIGILVVVGFFVIGSVSSLVCGL